MTRVTGEMIDAMLESHMAKSKSQVPTDEPTFGVGYRFPYDTRVLSSTYIVADSDSEAKAMLDRINLKMLKRSSRMHKRPEYFGPDYAQVFCISPSGGVSVDSKLSSGYPWIGLKVNDTFRLVTTREPVCMRTAADKAQIYPYYILKFALVEMIGDELSNTMIPALKRNTCMPVAVVSVAPSAGVGYPNEDEIANARRAVSFLLEKLKDHKSSLETEKVAVCALGYLLGQEFNRNKIMRCGWGDGDWANGEAREMSEEAVLEAINTVFKPGQCN